MKKFTLLFAFAFMASLIFGGSAFGQNITLVASSNATVAGDDAFSINKPAGIAIGDLMIASVISNDNSAGTDLTTAITLSGGWTAIDGRLIGSGTDPEHYGAILYRVATQADVDGTNYTVDVDNSADGSIATIVAFRGVAVTGGVAGTPFDVAPGIINSIATDNTLSAASVTTATANAAVVMFGYVGGNPNIGSWTATNPATLNELYDLSTTNGTATEIGAAWNVRTTAGATGAGSATLPANTVNGGIILALRPLPATATLTPAGPINIAVGGSINLTAAANNFAGSGNYTFTWTAAGATGLAPAVVNQGGNANAKNLTYAVAGTYTVSVSIARSGASTLATNTVTINVLAAPATPNLWATSSNGTQVSTFSVNGGVYFAGPTNLFVPTFPGTTTSGSSTAALARTDKPSIVNGYFYWLPNTSGNGGVVEVFGSDAVGGTQTRIGSIDVNGGGTGSLGFVRLGAGPDGTLYILAGDNSTLFLAKMKPSGVTLNGSLPVADQLTVVDASVTLVDGAVSTFQNGDICIAGDGNMVALANDGSGVTQIFVGTPNGASTTLTKKFDVLDENAANFTGSVNGVAFDLQGSLYVSAADGLYYINKNTVNGPAATIAINQVWAGTGLQDLASNVFPTTIITPVKLGTFAVVKSGSNAVLNWTTLTETNSSHFVVERSIDGINFSAAGTVQAAGTSTGAISYQFVDPITTSSNIIYYRLRTVDVDARSELSKIVALRLSGTAVTGFKVYPNPFTSDLKVQINSEKEAVVTVRINNALGQPVVNRRITLQSGENIVVLSNELATLNKGMYVLEIITENGKQTEKIIKR